MTIQIIKKSDKELLLRCLTLTHPKAIGELDKDGLVLYLNDGKVHNFKVTRSMHQDYPNLEMTSMIHYW